MVESERSEVAIQRHGWTVVGDDAQVKPDIGMVDFLRSAKILVRRGRYDDLCVDGKGDEAESRDEEKVEVHVAVDMGKGGVGDDDGETAARCEFGSDRCLRASFEAATRCDPTLIVDWANRHRWRPDKVGVS